MAIAAHWDEIDGVWDRVGLGKAQPLPGVGTITGSAGRNLDIKTRPQQDTAKIKNKGYRNAELTIVIQITTVEELNQLETDLAGIHPRKKGKLEDALALTHPVASLLGVKLVIVRTIHAPTVQNGLLEQRIDVIEFVPKPKEKKKGKPKIIHVDDFARPSFLDFNPDDPPSNLALGFIEIDSIP